MFCRIQSTKIHDKSQTKGDELKTTTLKRNWAINEIPIAPTSRERIPGLDSGKNILVC